MAVLRQALEVASASGGAFDPTVEPLVRAAGFLTERPRQLSKRARAHLLGRVSASHVHLDPEARRVRLDPGTSLDLGGIAKGYAADLALAALRDRCVTSGLVDLGSSSIGAFGQSLEIQVRDPERADASPWASFRVTQGAVSTSGGDQRPGHILDPRTGRAADRVLSATVVADAGIEADALSTALFVLGADAGLDLLRRRGAAGFVLLREHGQALLRTTPGFAGDFSLTPAPGVAVQ
jgi:thiamine biosynthesis lipoprotein